ncbi:MAG: DUF1592 domain-containing protein [Luteolibacter sp.]
MSLIWKIAICKTLFLGMFVLSGCDRGTEVVVEKAAEETQPSIVATNYAIACFVREMVDESSITIFDPLPAGENPSDWRPSMTQLLEINRTKPLVFIAGKEPSWVGLFKDKIKVVNLLPDDSMDFQAASNPSQALRILEKIGEEISGALPDIPIKDSAPAFHEALSAYESKWGKFSELTEKPKAVLSGSVRPPNDKGFLALVDENYDRFESALAKEARKDTFEGGILPILEQSCMECHDEAGQEGDLNLELYMTDELASLQPALWEKIAKVVQLERMPPLEKEKLQLSEEDKKKLYAWTESLTEKWDSGEMGSDPGKTTIHRLNKNEYNYTVRDLFGLKLRPADNFPEDGSGESGFDNNADSLFLPALLVENYFESAGIIVGAVYATSGTRSRYLFSRPGSKLSATEAARKIVSYWSALIYRKPAGEQEVERLLSLFEGEMKQKKPFDEAMKMPLYAMLVSPNFLYRSYESNDQSDAYEIDDFELASRLSYFLWSSMPDRELFQLAAKGELQDPEAIEAQVKRMLLDKKSKALGMHFGGQWFGWELLRSSANPDVEKYPQFTFQLRVLLYQESMMFFNDLLNSNGDIYKFLNSDYTFLNESLAKFYKIPGVEGNQLRRVTLDDENRGGVLGMGSVLTATSLPLRSSPSIRGSFVIQDILGIHLPEPPMNIAQLPEDDREIKGKTVRDSLAQHRDDPNCKSCHAMIDPIGFGLEAFDAIGRFRTHQNGVKLDTTGEMPSGTEFSSPAELKKVLLADKELFARHMVTKVLSYAIGRDMTPYDRPVIKEITDKVIADDGSIHTAFIEVAKSYPFRYRRNAGYSPQDEKTAISPKAARRKAAREAKAQNQ